MARGPDCPSNSGVAQGFGLIPVSVAGEGVQGGGGVEQKESKLETPRSDMVRGWKIFENARRRHLELVSPLATRTYVHVKKVSQLLTGAKHYED